MIFSPLPDFTVKYEHGGFRTLVALSEAAKDWLAEHIPHGWEGDGRVTFDSWSTEIDAIVRKIREANFTI